MEENFNPFDLSTPKKPKEPEAETEKPRAKPTVHRISMGPLFHSRFTKITALVLGVILAGLIGYTATNFYLNKKASETNLQQTASNSSSNPTSSASSNDSKSSADKTAVDPNNQQTPAVAASPNTPSTPSSSTAKVYCGVSGMPEGVCTAITSIEKDGLKGNQYVTQDTSSVPEGSIVTVDKPTWKSAGSGGSTVSFTAVINGQTAKGVGTFKQDNGVWKVFSYTLN